MLSKAILDDAKSYLCWEYDHNLTIQLIPIDGPVAYFFPPAEKISTIIVLFDKNNIDLSHAVFYLFHEVGHYVQYNQTNEKNQSDKFRNIIQLDKGSARVEFEQEAWELGGTIFRQFLLCRDLAVENILNAYTEFQATCLTSYYKDSD